MAAIDMELPQLPKPFPKNLQETLPTDQAAALKVSAERHVIIISSLSFASPRVIQTPIDLSHFFLLVHLTNAVLELGTLAVKRYAV